MPTQVFRRGFQSVVFAAEGNDFYLSLNTACTGHTITVQTSTVDKQASRDGTSRSLSPKGLLSGETSQEPPLRVDQPPCFDDLLTEHLSHRRVRYDSGVGNIEGRDPTNMRLNMPHLRSIQSSQSYQAVRLSPPFQFVQSRQFPFVDRNDQLTATLMRHVVLCTKAVKQIPAIRTQSSFERPWTVIKTGMDYAAIVTGLMCCNGVLRLDDHHMELPSQTPSRCQPHNSPTDDEQITLFHGSVTRFASQATKR
jgi:hypothetical protein